MVKWLGTRIANVVHRAIIRAMNGHVFERGDCSILQMDAEWGTQWKEIIWAADDRAWSTASGFLGIRMPRRRLFIICGSQAQVTDAMQQLKIAYVPIVPDFCVYEPYFNIIFLSGHGGDEQGRARALSCSTLKARLSLVQSTPAPMWLFDGLAAVLTSNQHSIEPQCGSRRQLYAYSLRDLLTETWPMAANREQHDFVGQSIAFTLFLRSKRTTVPRAWSILPELVRTGTPNEHIQQLEGAFDCSIDDVEHRFCEFIDEAPCSLPEQYLHVTNPGYA